MKITVLSNNAQSFPAIKEILEINCREDQLSYIRTDDKKIDIEQPNVASSDLLILDFFDCDDLEWSVVEEFNLRHPGSTTLLICPSDLDNLLIHAMRVGIRDVLNSPVVNDQLLNVIAKARVRVASTAGMNATAQIWTFIPCKGGSGTSFIASNLGYILSELHGHKVLLIDLDLHFGDTSFYISKDEHTGSLADVIRRSNLDAGIIESNCTKIGKQFWLLRAPANPEQGIGITADQIDNLITVASRSFDYVLIDLERALDPLSLRALDKSDLIFPFMQTMLPYIRGTQKLQKTFKVLHYPASKIKLIANRFDERSGLTIEQIEAALNTHFFKVLPNDFINATASMNSGKPLLEISKDSALTRSLIEMAKELVTPTSESANGYGNQADKPSSLWKKVASFFD